MAFKASRPSPKHEPSDALLKGLEGWLSWLSRFVFDRRVDKRRPRLILKQSWKRRSKAKESLKKQSWVRSSPHDAAAQAIFDPPSILPSLLVRCEEVSGLTIVDH